MAQSKNHSIQGCILEKWCQLMMMLARGDGLTKVTQSEKRSGSLAAGG
jgi:hypothetical protein